MNALSRGSLRNQKSKFGPPQKPRFSRNLFQKPSKIHKKIFFQILIDFPEPCLSNAENHLSLATSVLELFKAH